MKKVIKRILFLFVLSFFYGLALTDVYANYDIIVNGAKPCKLYEDKTGKKATGSCIYKNGDFDSYVSGAVWVDNGDKVTVLTNYEPIPAPKSGYGSECNTQFLKIRVKHNNISYSGYVCADLLQEVEITDELKEEFIAAGFTEEYSSYWEELAVLKKNHPNWKFIAIDTGLKFNTVVKNEDYGERSLYQSTSSSTEGYLSTEEGNYNWDKDEFIAHDGTSWFAANKETVEYYLDPRNFLSDMYIFQFESLAYEPEFHTAEGVKVLLGDAYIAKFVDLFMKAAETHDVSPIYLSSLSLQEVGSTKSTAISGVKFTYDGDTYSGLYNFYNIGATAGDNAVYRGLVYAATIPRNDDGTINTSKRYGRIWDTEEKAIVGGAEFIVKSYIKYGQNTSYFKKWNVVANYQKAQNKDYYNNYTHQYQQNIKAPSTEATSTYRSYAELGILESDFVFYIPIYDDMPEYTVLPAKGNPNNRLKALKIDGTTINGFESSEFEYEVYVENSVSSINLSATKINSAATVSGTGTKKLEVGENKLVITVKAQNGDLQTYTVTVHRALVDGEVSYPKVEEILKNAQITYKGEFISNLTFTTKTSDFINKIQSVSPTAKVEIKNGNTIKTSGYLVTGDTITITSGEDVKKYSVVLYGDINGNGKIEILDLLKVQNHALKSSILTAAYLEAADVNKDGKINPLDLLRIQKTILGDAYISQQ